MKIKIGLETHVQLNSKSKIFCGCGNPVNLKNEPEPNTLTCPACLGLPGSKPRTNAAVVDMALKVAVALKCKINSSMFFSRKTYFYPDMSKNFQITQYEVPLGKEGHVDILVNGKHKRINIRRLHMEEDPAKVTHIGGLGGKYTLIDYNRSGIPLIEVVTEPDFTSPMEARLFLQKLIMVLEYLGVYDSTSRAVVKSDANISINGGKRIEVKNITGTKEIEQALNYEMIRQNNIVSRGGKIEQATRMWNPDLRVTQELRTKETEEDYGYIFEPDLSCIDIGENKILSAGKAIPELPDEKYARFVKQYKVSPKVAESLVSELEIANLFEAVAKRVSPGIAGSWISGYLKKTLNWNGLTFRRSGLRQEWILKTLMLFEKGKLTDRAAEMVIRYMVEEKKDPETIIKKHELAKASDMNQIRKVVSEVIGKHRNAVDDYKMGEEKALHFLIGLCMRETKGRVDAQTFRKLILEKIK
jgi:aspartyl-tRNA(Asn)/glutamyl-tRNA(Gln) amidotransferase subunit B